MIAVGDQVEYARSRNWKVIHISETGGLSIIEDPWDAKVVPTDRLKKVNP